MVCFLCLVLGCFTPSVERGLVKKALPLPGSLGPVHNTLGLSVSFSRSTQHLTQRRLSVGIQIQTQKTQASLDSDIQTMKEFIRLRGLLTSMRTPFSSKRSRPSPSATNETRSAQQLRVAHCVERAISWTEDFCFEGIPKVRRRNVRKVAGHHKQRRVATQGTHYSPQQ
jgi:hypothetical protein